MPLLSVTAVFPAVKTAVAPLVGAANVTVTSAAARAFQRSATSLM